MMSSIARFLRRFAWPESGWNLLYLLPPLLTLGFIFRFGVDIPHVDSFLLIYTFDAIDLGELTFADLWTPHNEHRILFLRLFASGLAFLTGWNAFAEFVLSWCFAVVSFVGLCWVAARARPECDRPDLRNHHWPNLVTGVLVFSWVQHENWLWGFQIAWLWIVTCLVVAIALLAHRPLQKRPDPLDRHFWLAALFCMFASFSSAHGLLTWLAIAPTLLLTRNGWRPTSRSFLTWLGLTATTFALYFHGYTSPDDAIDRLYAFRYPLEGARYALTLLGHGISTTDALTCGIAIFVGFGVCCGLFVADRPCRDRLAPWISLGLFALGFAAMTAIGRTSLGIGSALASRYTTIAALAIVAIVQIAAVYLSRSRWQNGYRLACGVLAAVSIYGSIAVLPEVQQIQRDRQSARQCLTLIEYMQPRPNRCLGHVFPNPKTLKADLAVSMDRLGFYESARGLEFVEAPDESYGVVDTQGAIEVGANENIVLSGWAILPNREAVPGWVFLSQGDRREFFAEARVDRDSPDLVEHFQNPAYDRARWSAEFPAAMLSEPVTTIYAWAYDAAGKRFVRLEGAIEVRQLSETVR